MEKLLDALRETLAQLGLDEQAINAALEEAMAKASAEEDPAPASDPDVPTQEGEVPPAEPEVPAEEVPSEVPSADLPTEEVPPTEGEPVVPPEEVVPPVEPEVPVVPPFDPTQLLEQVSMLQGQLEEQKKANEGLITRIQALEESLKKAGVISEGNPVNEVGDQLPSAAPQSPTDDVFGDVMREINGNKRF